MSFCAATCASSVRAAIMADCTGAGTIIPACLRVLIMFGMICASPAINAARYPARFDCFESE